MPKKPKMPKKDKPNKSYGKSMLKPKGKKK